MASRWIFGDRPPHPRCVAPHKPNFWNIS